MNPAEGQGRARGRARGRGRGQVPDAQGPASAPTFHGRPAGPQTQAQAPRPGATPQAAGFQPTAQAVGRARGRARGQAPTEAAEARPTQQAGVGGRAAYRGVEKGSVHLGQLTQSMGAMKIQEQGPSEGSGNGNGNGNGNGAHESSVGRGIMRGRREIANIIWTKPQNITEKRGVTGHALTLVTNYFTLVKKQDWKLCLYHVDFSPEEDRTHIRKRLLRQHTQAIGDEYIFDGMQLYLPYKLGSDVTELASKREVDQAIYQVKIKFIKELSPMDNQYLQILGILLRKCMDLLGLQLIGRNYYNPKAQARDENHKIIIWPGFCTSIRQHEQSLLLNADVMHKFLRSDTAYDVLRSGRGQRGDGGKDLLGSIVMTKYNERTYRIDDIAWNCTPESKFQYKGGEISYLEYYEKNYSVVIKDRKQPMLLSKPKKSDLRRGSGMIYLVPELCVMTGLTDNMRADFNMMKDLSAYMRMGPDKRVAALLRFNKDLATNKAVQTEMKNWGLQLSPNLVQVQGRALPDEQIVQGGQKVSFNRKTADWSRETRSLQLNVAIELRDWVMIFPAKFSNDARELLNTFQRVGPPLGMYVAQPAMKSLRGDAAAEYVASFNDLAGKQMILCILPNNRLDRYSAIKRHLCLKMGIPSQCILSRTLMKKQRLMSVATKVAVQMNCKLGGEPWSVDIPIKNAMVIGYDAYHDKVTRGSSYGAVVSSINQSWTRYFSQVSKHMNKEELTDNFATGVKKALQQYIIHNGQQPNMVIVYRDGVGEGQIEHVKNHEIGAIKQCFSMTCERPPKFAFIIVSKRITTRILIDDRGHVDNPIPGTVVDDVITLPERYDFFLVSQSVNQGTVSPTSFNIIEDTTGLKPDHMQRLAYKMTHMYYNWQGTIRVPAPCMFAHKLAFMTGQALNGPPHSNLLDRLWYL